MKKLKYRKVYIDMITVMKQDGTVMPKRFIWENGEKFDIDRILHITPAASTKVGGNGMRYTVTVHGQERYIFRDEDRWFVEAPIITQE